MAKRLGWLFGANGIVEFAIGKWHNGGGFQEECIFVMVG